MSWPLSQDYNEAIQCPAGNFTDPDLRRGQPATNTFGVPMPCSGNFADVYQLCCPDGSRWAVKCFTRETPGLRERYAEITRHLSRAKLPFTVDFDFLQQGIRVNGQWFPVLKMQWVEGLTLNQFVARAADKPATLEALLHIWVRMGQYLRAAELAHGDLQHGNVLLVPGAGANSLALKFVDYDGMWVPALAGKRSGEVGHPSYQHPWRAREGTHGPEVDRFPLLLVATALSALKLKGRAFWEKYDDGDNLLFTRADLDAPGKSALFYELLKLEDPTVRRLAENLIEAARRPLELTPLLEELIPGARPAPGSDGWVQAGVPPRVSKAIIASPIAQTEPTRPDYSGQRRRGNSAFLWIAGAGGTALLAVVVGVIVLLANTGARHFAARTASPVAKEGLTSGRGIEATQTAPQERAEGLTSGRGIEATQTAPKERPADKPKALPAGKPDIQIAVLAGEWKITYTNKYVRLYTITAYGKVSFAQEKLNGQIKRKDGVLLLIFDGDNRLERLRLSTDGRLFVEHYNPRSDFPAKPDCTGIGVRTAGLSK